jgi:hypothetical protein
MATEPESLVLEHLRHMRGKLDGVADDVKLLGLRMAAMERHMAGMYTSETYQSDELDRLKRRVDRIEQRLELAE